MKRFVFITIYLICLNLFMVQSAFCQKEFKPKTKIEKITVFPNNAQIERSATANLPSGQSEIILSGLSQYIDAQSLRVSGKGAFVIMSQQVQIKYPEPKVSQVEVPHQIVRSIKLLSDSLELLNFDFGELIAKREVLQSEKTFLNSSTAITKTDTIVAIKDALSFYRTKMNEINQEFNKLAKQERLLLIRKKEMETRLTDLKNYSKNNVPEPTHKNPEAEIRIQVMAEKADAGAQINVSYIVSQVSWAPFYELKVDEVSKPVQLHMKANIVQNTGENWDKAYLVFSTGTPAVYKRLPNLPTWYLGYIQNNQFKTDAGQPMAVTSTETMKKNREMLEEVTDMSMSRYTQLSQSLVSTEYVVSIPYNIPSDGKTNTITLLNEKLDAYYKYVAVPKTDKDVFLTASLKGWEKLNLINGQAHIVYQNSIISKTHIDAGIVMDSLWVALGTDKRVVVERKKLSDKSKEKIIGSTIERSMSYEITIKNQNQTDIILSLKDQVPISNLDDIKVVVEEITGAKYNVHTGELEWELTLKPNEIKKLQFRYTVKHDKNKPLRIS